ncbi:maleylacetate reductase [Paeniglutamicibacter sp. ZC-3]|uniref:maleylacetate reductase n=1 Tax=Paeniglutamicibacter sp. ZC-3 TaxID=2986919 RepID=UPI0021F720A0|nr:maleylacetate reductase [Paeniglutamicibacter sp. ZC-3]MCV9996350.1 maleylacetate reductase [Paeniglutamicibacter sp. ZC-3]
MGLLFSHDTLPQRVLFGTGKAAEHLAAEVAAFGATRVMMIAGRRDANTAAGLSARLPVVLHYSDIVQHVPIESAARARAAAREHRVDLLVCLGGGSAVGLAKAVALDTGLPVIAIPTTYAGSEATNVWGLTEDGRKKTGVDARVLPATVIYDAQLSLSLPSGLNAMAHCIDSLWGPRADPINAALAAEGIRALATGLPAIAADPSGIDGREQALYGAYLSAVAFASAGSGLHHKICHVLGGTWNMPHAQTHATVLPYVLAFNAPHAPEAESRIAAAFGSPTALEGLNALRKRLDAPRALKNYGFDAADIPEAVSLILPQVPAINPRTVTGENLTELLTAALHGTDAAGLSPVKA